MVSTTEIAKDVFRVSVYVPEINLEFSHFLIRDDEPLLFHTGLRGMFPILREQISRLMDVSKLRHIGFSHFESDECGALNHWLEVAPNAQPVCGLVGALVSVNDFSNKPSRVLTKDDVLSTGQHRFRFIPTFRTAGTPVSSSKKPNRLCSARIFSTSGGATLQPPRTASWTAAKTHWFKPKRVHLRITFHTRTTLDACWRS